jgi:2-dehydropantoate 2-reductase
LPPRASCIAFGSWPTDGWQSIMEWASTRDETVATVPIAVVHITGLGAVGTAMAIALARAGVEVHTYRGRGPDVRVLRASYGDRVERAVVRHHRCVEPVVRDGDAVLIAVKWPHLRRVLSRLAPSMTRDNPLFLPQNGLPDLELRSLAARRHVVPVVVHAATRSVCRGAIVVHTKPRFLMPHSAGVSSGASLEREGFAFLDARQFAVEQRLKMLVACTSAPMALRGASIGEAFADTALRGELVAVAREAAAVLVAHAHGDPRLKREADVLIRKMDTGSFVDTRLMRAAYTSLHEDLNERRAKTETPWLNGLIVRLGRRLGLPTHLNASIVSMVRQVERRQAAAQRKERV